MTNQEKQIAPTPRYAALQGSFWATFCIIFAYASVYLLSKGYSNSQIGLVIAVAGIISALLQPVVADFADRCRRGTLRYMISFWSAVIIMVAAALLIPHMNFLLIGVFYGVAVAGLQILTPLVNAIGMECINHGIPVNFGLARGIGSVTYAAVSYIAGKLVAEYDTNVIPMMIIFFYLLLIVTSLTFYFRDEPANNECAENKNIENKQIENKNIESGHIESKYIESEHIENNHIEKVITLDKGNFFTHYKRFFLLLVAVTFSFISHNLLNNYMFQVMEYHGGGSGEMGTALAIAATIELPTMLCFSLLIRKFQSSTLLKVSVTFFMVKALLTFLAPNVYGVYVAQLTQFLGFALQVPSSVYYVNSLMKPKDRVKGQAFMTMTNTLGSIGGSLIGGMVLDAFGVKALLLISVTMAAFGMLITFVSTEKLD
ncbi:MAG: MFS transporter [Lachnospiraceae bacterium]|nr:MFS transporter [Lachnospiraceae bacterium]